MSWALASVAAPAHCTAADPSSSAWTNLRWLSPVYAEQVFDIIQTINRQGTTSLWSNRMPMALVIADRAYVLQTGQISTGTGTSMSSSGSQWTLRWRRQSRANSSLKPNSLASWENTGNFVRLGLRVRLLARNWAGNSMVCDAIPYALEQGIYFGLAGN